MLVCRICGWENPVNAAFCTNCGAGLARGKSTSEGGRFKALSSAPKEVPQAEDELALPKLKAPPAPVVEEKPTILDFRVAAEMRAEVAKLKPSETTADGGAPVLDDGDGRSEAVVDLGAVARALRAEATPSTTPEAEAIDEPEAPEPEAPEPGAVELESPGGSGERTLLAPPVDGEGGSRPGASDEVGEAEEPDEPSEDDFDVDRSPPPADDDLVDALEELSSIDEGLEDLVSSVSESSSPSGEDDELYELSTSELHSIPPGELPPAVLDTGELEALAVEERETADRAGPPPIPEVNARFLLRPLSENVARASLVPVGDEPVVVGREGADVDFPTDEHLSPRHARFAVEEDQLVVEDLDSLNGVWLRIRVEARLGDGDTVLLGRQLLRVERAGARAGQGDAGDATRRLGAPTEGREWRLVQLGDDGAGLDLYHLAPGGCRIGRHIADLVFTEDTFMSGTHALLRPGDDAVVVRDLDSRNGSWLRIDERRRLEPGDAVMLGRTVWRVSATVD